MLLSLALLLCSVNDAWGRLKKKDPQPTELGIDSPRDGMMLAFNRIEQDSEGYEADLWLCADGDISPVLTREYAGEPQKNKTGWVLEASDVVIKQGAQSFYLRNFETGDYISFDESDTDELPSLFLGGKEVAKPFIIIPTKQGVPLMGFEQTDFGYKGGVLKDGDWMILSKINGAYCAVNTVSEKAFISMLYADYATWYTAYEVEVDESVSAVLEEAVEEMPELNVNCKSGVNPGCYPQELIDEYVSALEAVYDLYYGMTPETTKEEADAAVERLKRANAAFEAGQIPVTTGYYRIVNACPRFEESQGIRYAMTTNDDVPAWRALGTTDECEVWYITALEGNKVTVQNVGNALYLIGTESNTSSSPVNIMSEEPRGDMTITFFGKASSARIKYNGGYDFHAEGHGNGWGTGGDIVLWNGNADDASAWFIEAVPAEEFAQYDAILQQNKLSRQLSMEFKKVLAVATEKYNIAAKYKTGDGLITTVDQLSTNADHNAITGYPDGQGLAGLIDGDVHTFFHSLWRNVDGAPDAYHNLTVDLKTPLSKFAFSMTPRKYTPGYSYETEPNDYMEYVELLNRPTEIILYGAEAGADIAQPESWKKLQLITGLPSSRDKSVADEDLAFTSLCYQLPGDYQYLRFEVIKTNNSASITVNGHTYPFFSMAEFQIYNAELDPNCQLVTLGEVGKAFEEAYKKALCVETPTQQDIDDLKAALQALYEGGFADSTELKEKLDEANTILEGIVEVEEESASQPGFYRKGTRESLREAVAVAQNYYDAPMDYTAEGLQEQVTVLASAIEAALSAQYALATDTWYRIRHAQIFYEANGVPELQPEDRTGEIYVVNGAGEAVEEGNACYGNPEDLGDVADAQFLWRLIPLEDGGGYVLQNKATGMFMGGIQVGTMNRMGVSVNPVRFTVEHVGYASFALTATEFDGSSWGERSILHAATSGRYVVYWNTKGLPVLNEENWYISSNSGTNWEFVPVEKVDEVEVANYSIGTIVHSGELRTACYPFSTTITGKNLTVYGISSVNTDSRVLYLKEEETSDAIKLEAGKPIFYVANGLPSDGRIGREEIPVKVKINTDFVKAPQESNGLIGQFRNKAFAGLYGAVRAMNGRNMVVMANVGDLIGANRAYLASEFMVNGSLTVADAAQTVDLRISDAGFATLMLPYEAALPEGVKAYSASQAGETLANGCRVLTLEKADVLQANTPYIIEGVPGTYTFSGAVTNTQDTYTNGWLTGTFVGTQAQAGTYVLQNNNGITGFYRVAAGKEPQVGANRAWLSVPAEEGATAEVTAFVFGDDSATGIEGVDASDRRVDVYTLEGVRVRTDVRMSEALKALPRGVYVVNGTKKAVK